MVISTFIWFPATTITLKAQQPIVFTDSLTSISLTNQLEVYIDENNSVSAKQILNIYKNKGFTKKLNDLGLYSRATVWVYAPIENKTNSQLFLALTPGTINYVSAFTVKDNVIIDSIAIGSLSSAKNKHAFVGKTAFVVPPGKSEYFIRVKSNTYLPFTVVLHDKKTFFHKKHIRNIINGILFGALVLSFLYNLLLFFSIRDTAYLYFSIFIFLGAIIISYNFGIINQFSSYRILSKYITSAYVLFLIATALFVISFLELKNTLPYRNFKIFIALFIIICIIDLLGFHLLANFSLFILGGIFHLYIFIVVVQEEREDKPPAKLFSVPWALTILAYLILGANKLFLQTPLVISYDFIAYSGYINMILLSLAIGNRINIYSKKQEKAREKELAALRERDSIISIQKVKLEEIVQERNRELIDKNRVLSVQQKAIETQTDEMGLKNQEIDHLNKQLQLKNTQIETQNTSLEKNKQELETIVAQRTKELELAKEKAIVADTLKTSFLNNLSREIKTPMSAITGYAGLLVDKTISITQRNEYLHIIIQNVHTLLSLIDNIVTLSRIQAGIIKLKFQEFDLVAFIKLVADEFIENLDDPKSKNIKIITKIPNNIKELTVNFDYNKLWLLYRHLVENSIKYTEKGHIEIGFKLENDKRNSLQETKSAPQTTKRIVFFVKDTGIGISDKDIDKFIIKKNTDINKYQFRQEGIGLAIVTGLTDLFNAKIEVENINGTAFYIKTDIEIINQQHE